MKKISLIMLLFLFVASLWAEEKISQKQYELRQEAEKILLDKDAAQAILYITEFEKKSKEPLHRYLLEFRGSLLAQAEKYELAAKDYLAAFQQFETKENILGLGLCYLNLEDVFAAENLFRRGVVTFHQEVSFKRALLECLLKQERYTEGVALLTSLLKDHEEDKELQYLAGQLYWQTNQLTKALACFQLVELMGEPKDKVLTSCFDILCQLNLMNKAEEYFIRLNEKQQTESRKRNLVVGFMRQMQYQKALHWIKQCQSNEESVRLKVYWADAMKEEDSKKALALLDDIGNMKINDGQYFFVRGKVLMLLGKKEEAVSVFYEAASFHEFKRSAYWQIFAIHQGMGQRDACVSIIKKILELEPNHRTALNLLEHYSEE